MSQLDRGGPAVPPVSPGPGWPTTPPPHRPLGTGDPREAGPYRLEAVLGAGGMGRVYLGRTPAGSEVAVKLVHREYAGDRAFRKRFEQEVAAAGRVQGLYTVPVVDADLQAEEPWLATAYVPGPSLQDAVDDEGPLPEAAALGLVAKVAEALQSIHAAGVIHRDLKPSNIILTAEGPKVIDFGIARAADVTSVTGTGMRAGTPGYMAPEYIRGHELTEAVDVFALGLVAHFAVTARLAFGGGSAHGVTYRILEQEPDLDGCPAPVRTVAARCLAKDPQQRPDPAAVIQLCRGNPAPEATVVDVHSAPTRPAHSAVPAPPPTKQDPEEAAPSRPASPSPPVGYSPFAALAAPLRRGRGGAGAGGVVLGLVLVLAVVLTVFLVPWGGTGGDSPPWLKPTVTLTGPGDSAADVAFSPDGRTLAAGVQQGKLRLWDVATRKQRATLEQRDERGEEQLQRISSVEFSPDGKVLAGAAGDHTVGLWDLAGRRQVATFEASPTDQVRDIAFSPDGKVLATGSEDGKVRLWDVDSSETRRIATLDHGQPVWNVVFSPDGGTVASAAYDPAGSSLHTAMLWDVADHTSAHALRHPKSVAGVAFGKDGTTLFTVGSDDRIRQWDVNSGREKDPLAEGGFTSADGVVSSSDGKTLATFAWTEARLWNPDDGTPRAVLTGHKDSVESVAVSPGGGLVATTARDGKLRMWKVPKAG
ncbi:WD40 repeat domain-containing serine/threonine protein kinase [Streptomyces sp. WMMB 322]|uniref:WD40 repeat domain-containing serine/threonine protein kinase n=1 Tax=Streptomyces sp. WMMB 322 TaxID=1286821 RepID=UPI000823F079|nr:serine/threonine-protein kinase [Streptomyces sp. WMMB 322]SCK49763.1 WD domain-containing protein, G-beta repeat-containing protein [Streptomyces sp. WMMB 322]